MSAFTKWQLTVNHDVCNFLRCTCYAFYRLYFLCAWTVCSTVIL